MAGIRGLEVEDLGPRYGSAPRIRSPEALRFAAERGGVGPTTPPGWTAPPAAPPVAPPVAPAAAAETAEKISKAGKLRGFLSSAAQSVAEAPGKLMNANVAPALRWAGRAVPGAAVGGSLLEGVMRAPGTSTEDYEKRTGLTAGDSFLGNVKVRAAGLAQDVGNLMTAGLADRVGNWISGRGFNRSEGNQVGEIGGPGQEVSGGPLTAPPPTVTPYSNEGRTRPTPVVAEPAPVTLRTDPPKYPAASFVGNNDGGASLRGIYARESAANKRIGELSRELDAYGTGASGGGAVGIGGTTISQDLRAKTNAGQSTIRNDGSLSPRTQVAAQSNQIAADRNDLERTIAANRDAVNLRTAGLASDTQLATNANTNATSRANNELTNATASRGHELEYDARQLPLRMQMQKQADTKVFLDASKNDPAVAAQLAASAGRADIAKDLNESVTSFQTQAGKEQDIRKAQEDRTAKLFEGRFNHLVPEDVKGDQRVVQQKALEVEGYNLAKQHLPGFDQMNPTDQAAAMPKIMGLLEVIKKGGNPEFSGWAGILPNAVTGRKQPQQTNALREQAFYQGGDVGSPYGFFEGALSPGYEKGDVSFKLPGSQGGGSIRMPQLTAEGAAVLRDLSKGKRTIREMMPDK